MLIPSPGEKHAHLVIALLLRDRIDIAQLFGSYFLFINVFERVAVVTYIQ